MGETQHGIPKPSTTTFVFVIYGVPTQGLWYGGYMGQEARGLQARDMGDYMDYTLLGIGYMTMAIGYGYWVLVMGIGYMAID